MTGIRLSQHIHGQYPSHLGLKVKKYTRDHEDILKESFSDYVNPFTVVEKPQKRIRICTDARRINTLMTPE